MGHGGITLFFKEINMGMSTYVEGFHPRDEEWEKMKAVYDSCMAARIPLPQEIEAFFDGEPPDESGIKVCLDGHECVSKYHDDFKDGIEIDISMLPKNVTKIRFVNSY